MNLKCPVCKKEYTPLPEIDDWVEELCGDCKSLYDKRFIEIIEYCKPHLDLMWAASIVGIILNCDFRDCKSELMKRGL